MYDMVTLKVIVGGEEIPLQEEVVCFLSNTETGPRMRSPWNFTILNLTTEQATTLARHIIDSTTKERTHD